MLTEPIDADEQGYIHLSDEPGLGIQLNEEILMATKSKIATYQ